MTHSITVINPFGGSSHRQSIWERMAVESDLQIRFFVPNIWKDEYGITAKCNTESTRLKIEPLQIALNGNIPLHFFKSLNTLKTAISESNLTYIYHEPFFLSTIQIARIIPRQVKFGFHTAQNLSRHYPFPFNVGEKFVFQKALFATAVSAEAKDVLRQRGFMGSIGEHRFGLDDVWFNTCKQVEGIPTFAYIGRFVEEKGLQIIIHVFSQLKTRCKLIFVGEGPLRAQLDASLGILSNHDVVLMGRKSNDEIVSILDTVDFTLVPSKTTKKWKEQFGRVVIESGARGAIPIVSNSGELPHLASELTFVKVFEENSISSLLTLIKNQLQNLDVYRTERHIRQDMTQRIFSESKIARDLVHYLKDLI